MEQPFDRLRNNCRKYLISILIVTNTTFIGTTFGADEFSIEVPMKEVRNEYSEDIEYHPTSLTIIENNDFCKTGNCNYEISGGKLVQLFLNQSLLR